MAFFKVNVDMTVFLVFLLLIRKIRPKKLSVNHYLFVEKLTVILLIIPIRISYYLGKVLSNDNISTLNSITKEISKQIPVNIQQNVGEKNLNPLVDQYKISLTNLFVYFWIAGTISFFIYYIAQYIKQYNALKFSTPVVDIYPAKNGTMLSKLERNICLKKLQTVSAPITTGILKPCIILPTYLDTTNEEQMEYIYTHEKIHILRFDNAWKFLLIFMKCIHWYNPLIWILAKTMTRDMEIACDEKVIQILGNAKKEGYARTLLKLLDKSNLITEFNVAFSDGTMEERIESIMNYKKISNITKYFIIAIILSLVSGYSIFVFAGTNIPFISTLDSDILNINNWYETETDFDISSIKEIKTVGSDADIHSYAIKPQNYIIYKNNNGNWKFKQGDNITINIELADIGFGQSTLIGYINDIEADDISWTQFTGKQSLDLTIPSDGEYSFFVASYSSDPVYITNFDIIY